MGKMHELLAVEQSVVGNYNRDLDETLKVMGRADLFTKQVTKKEFFNAEDSKLNTVTSKEMTTSVKERLAWFSKAATKFYDMVLQKDSTNQLSKADVVLDNGTVIAKDVPATTLLMFESKLQDLRKVFESAPTLAAGFKWEEDATSVNVFHSAEPVVNFTTKKSTKPVVLYEATKEHPAQVKEVSEDVPVAKVTVDTYSSMITSKDKAEMLGRLDDLLHAVKKARQRANTVDVVKANVGDQIFNYLFKDLGVKN